MTDELAAQFYHADTQACTGRRRWPTWADAPETTKAIYRRYEQLAKEYYECNTRR